MQHIYRSAAVNKRVTGWIFGLLLSAAVLGLFGGTGARAQSGFAPVDLGTLCNTPGFASTAYAVSANGSVVVGQSCAVDDNGIASHAFRWTSAGGMVDLGGVNANPIFSAQANGVSADGSVVVGDTNAGNSGTHQAFRWTSGGGAVQLGVLPDQCCVGQASANAVTPDGNVIVGWGTSSAANSAEHAAIWVGGGTPTDLGTLTGGPTSTTHSFATAVSADGAVVVGNADSVAFGPRVAFRWTSGGGMVSLGTLSTNANGQSFATGVSADGSIVVGYTDVGNTASGVEQHAFMWTQAGGMVDLGFAGTSNPPGGGSTGLGVSTSGAVVVGYTTTDGGNGGLGRWTSATGMKDLNALLASAGVNMTGILLGRANAVSSNGQYMVGQGGFSGQLHAYLARYLDASVPGIATHDFNGDAKSDLAWRHFEGDAAIWLMNGATVSQAAGLGTIPPDWQIIGQRDFNGDGKHDLLWRNGATGDVAIWLMNGTTISQTGSIGTVPTTWNIVGTSDFNGDGKADILWRNSVSGAVAIWLMNGLTVSQTAGIGTVPNNWTLVGSDGKGHILWRDTDTGTVALWVMDGLTIAQSVSLGAVPLNWSIVGAGDFSGLGKTCSDIVWRDTGTGMVAIWQVDNGVVTQTGSLGAVPGNWFIIVTGDFDGDGKTDLLWRDNTAGTVAIWFMNGTTVASTATVGTVPIDWTVQGMNAD